MVDDLRKDRRRGVEMGTEERRKKSGSHTSSILYVSIYKSNVIVW